MYRQTRPRDTVEPVYNGHPWDHAEWLLYRGGLIIEVGGALDGWMDGWMEFGTYPILAGI